MTPTTPSDDRADATRSSSASRVGPHAMRPDLRCTAKTRAGERCGNFPMRGSTVCRMHGGAAKAVRAAAARRLAAEKAEAEMRAALEAEDLQVVANPLEEVSRLAAEALAMKDRLADTIESMSNWRYTAHGAGTEQLRAEVALYERAMDRSAKFLDLLVKSGFEERRTALAERQGQMVAEVLRAILTRLLDGVVSVDGVADNPALSGAVRQRWQELVPVVVPDELRKLDRGTVPGQVVRR